MPMLFRYKCNSHSVLSHPIFFDERACCYFGNIVVILHIAPTVSCSAEQSLIFLGRPKTNLRSTMEQVRLSRLALLCIEHAYVNRVDSNQF